MKDQTPSQNISRVRALLEDARQRLNTAVRNDVLRAQTPIEVLTAIECAAQAITNAILLIGDLPIAKAPSPQIKGAPTRQQGQFLAFIREYIIRNEAGAAPAHADFQRFFDLTPPSVNSMLIRLEQRGFIRRIPGKARAIELTVNPDRIPPLDRPLKFW